MLSFSVPLNFKYIWFIPSPRLIPTFSESSLNSFSGIFTAILDIILLKKLSLFKFTGIYHNLAIQNCLKSIKALSFIMARYLVMVILLRPMYLAISLEVTPKGLFLIKSTILFSVPISNILFSTIPISLTNATRKDKSCLYIKITIIDYQ